MAADGRGQRIQQLFLKAARMSAVERESWLRIECAGDVDIYEEVCSLLEYESPAYDPFESGLSAVADSLPLFHHGKQESSVVPGYEIVREIGKGGQAIVYEAIQKSTTQRVALKLLRWGEIASKHERERLRREVLILAKLRHPGIVSVIDSGKTESGVLYVATEFIDGPSLDKIYGSNAEHGNLSQSKVLRVFRKICQAVQAAHDAGVVHRDLKPANILLAEGNEPLVLDFGLAKSDSQDWRDSTSVDALTVSGQFMGSLPWASPEQAEGKKVDTRSDIYSLGVILYQLISGGDFPYDVTGSMQDVITKIMHADPTPLDRVTHDTRQIQNTPTNCLVDRELNAIVMKSLSKSPGDRHQTAAELELAVNQYIAATRREIPPAKPLGVQNTFIAVAVLLSIVACFASIFGPFSNRRQEPAQVQEIEVATKEQTPKIAVPWVSYHGELANLSKEGSVTRISDGWRVRQDEIRFPDVRAKNLLVRCSLRRYSPDPVVLRLTSSDGAEISVEVSHVPDEDIDRVTLRTSGFGFLVAEAEGESMVGDTAELAIALLPDRIAVRYDGQVLMQMHVRSQLESWTPLLAAKSADVDIVEIGHAQTKSVPTDFTAAVVDEELPAIEYTVNVGGAALSQPLDSGGDSQFHVTQITTASGGDSTFGHELAKLVDCKRLTRLEVGRIKESSEAMQHIAKIRSLTRLEIKWSELEDDCFHDLAELENLQVIGLSRTRVRNPDFASLLRLKSLRELRIPLIQVTDADLELLSNIPTLIGIGAQGDQVSAAGFRSLTKLKDLFALELPQSQVSGEGIQALTQLKNLWKLDVSGSDLGDQDIPNFSKMPGLSHLVIQETQLTAAGVAELRRSLPRCSVTWGDRN